MHRTTVTFTTAGLVMTCLACTGSATPAAAADTTDPHHRTKLSPSLAPQLGGHIYINYHTGERVFSPRALPRPGHAERGVWAGWANVYPDPCDPTQEPGEQAFWYEALHDADLGDEPAPNPLAVAAWHDWIETTGDARFSSIEISYATFVPDPDPEGGRIPGHDFYLAFTENDRFTNRSIALAHTPIAITELPGDINAGAGTRWVITVDFDPDHIELGDTDNSTTNPQGVDPDGDGLIDSGYVFTFNQPGVGEGDVLANTFPELKGAYEGLTDPLDTATFPNIADIGPALAHPSRYAGVNGEPDCYAGEGEWPRVAGCDDQSPAPLGTFDGYDLIDATGTSAGVYYFGGFECVDNGPGMPHNTPWASPYIQFGYSYVCLSCECPADFAEPFGILDLADITAFATFFQAGDPIADFAGPFGVLDLADITAFIAAFQFGCP